MVAPAIRQSVQTAPVHTDKNSAQPVDSANGFWTGIIRHEDNTPTWGNRSRDLYNRSIYLAVGNSLFQGAASGVSKELAATPTQVQGKPYISRYYQDMLANCQGGEGWTVFIEKLTEAFLIYDFGVVVEIVGAGNPARGITGRVTDISVMDTLSCAATKSVEYPIVYWNEEDNKMHRMHRERVNRLVDSPSNRRTAYGMGLSAMSRYLAQAKADLLLSKYTNEQLSDLPPVGILAVSGMTDQHWKDAQARYEAGRVQDGQEVWRNTMVLYSIDPANPLDIKMIPFSSLPGDFDIEKYRRDHVNILANSMNIDPQDIWPLSGQALGTGTQSEILHQKAKGKLKGYLRQKITRFLNWHVLPDGVEFSFEFKDDEADKAVAERAQIWAGIASSLPMLSDEQKLRLLANNVEQFAEVLLDEAGELIELPDDDPKEDEVIADDLTALTTPTEEETPDEADPDEQPDTNLPGQRGLAVNDRIDRSVRKSPDTQADLGGRHNADHRVALKDYGDTKDSFVSDVQAIIDDAANGVTSKAAFGIRMRAAINKYGKAAYLDGLALGGVEVETLEGDDSETFATLLADNSKYVTNLANEIYADDGSLKGSPDVRASMWGNKTLEPFYQAGIASGDINGLYTWQYGDTEHCDDCQRLNGQKHRMKDWIKSGWKPKSDKLACKGFNCKCEWKKTTGAPRGSY